MIELTGKLPKYCRNTGNLIDPRFNIDGFNEQRDYPKREHMQKHMQLLGQVKRRWVLNYPLVAGRLCTKGKI